VSSASSKIVRREELGSKWNFEIVRQDIEAILRLINELDSLNLAALSLDRLSVLVGLVSDVSSLFERMRGFQGVGATAEADHRTAIDQTVDRHDRLFAHASPVLSYAARDNSPLKRSQADCRAGGRRGYQGCPGGPGASKQSSARWSKHLLPLLPRLLSLRKPNTLPNNGSRVA
jgi:hypothetical protein